LKVKTQLTSVSEDLGWDNPPNITEEW